jgi:hypothetical protein
VNTDYKKKTWGHREEATKKGEVHLLQNKGNEEALALLITFHRGQWGKGALN